MPNKMSFAEACARYVHRFTMEHVPAWARRSFREQGGTTSAYYAPQFRSDAEWYANTVFPPHNEFHKRDCYTSGQTWPLGEQLSAPFSARN